MTHIDPRAPAIGVAGGAAALDRRRCRAVCGLLARLGAAAGGAAGAEASTATGAGVSTATGATASIATGAAAPGAARLAAALAALTAAGRLGFAPAAGGDADVDVIYTPSRAANLAVLAAAAADGTGFPEPVRRKHAAALRTASGALLRFPPEEGGQPLEVFITDWSPCPAAAAVAVHRDHPWLAGRDQPPGPFFAGRYVRHPLTGDLLPVWAADWVRPDFGTGAVLVNPAHDPVDLAFGRAAGLPIRFALAPAGHDDRPEQWLAPPLVRTGVAIRAGRYDGLEAPAAMAAYFTTLAGRGLAERVQDVQAGRVPIGRLLADPEGAFTWDCSRRRLAAAAGAAPGQPVAPSGSPSAARRVRLEPAELLAAALTAAAAPAAAPVIVCPASEQSGALLFLRLLVHDLCGTPLVPSAVVLVQKVQETAVDAAPEVVELGLLAGAPLPQVVVLKQQVIEQAGRFVRVHRELAAAADGGVRPQTDRGSAAAGAASAADAASAASAEEGASGVPPLRALVRAKEALLAAEPARAFELLKQVQKQLAGQPLPPPQALDDYFAAAWVLTGLAAPAGAAAPARWARI